MCVAFCLLFFLLAQRSQFCQRIPPVSLDAFSCHSTLLYGFTDEDVRRAAQQLDASNIVTGTAMDEIMHRKGVFVEVALHSVSVKLHNLTMKDIEALDALTADEQRNVLQAFAQKACPQKALEVQVLGFLEADNQLYLSDPTCAPVDVGPPPLAEPFFYGAWETNGMKLAEQRRFEKRLVDLLKVVRRESYRRENSLCKFASEAISLLGVVNRGTTVVERMDAEKDWVDRVGPLLGQRTGYVWKDPRLSNPPGKTVVWTFAWDKAFFDEAVALVQKSLALWSCQYDVKMNGRL